MAERTVQCARLAKELPGIDESTPDGQQALKMALLLGGAEMQQRVHDNISAEAWSQWKDRMMIIMNEYHLDPTSDESNAVLKEHMEAFLFGREKDVEGYVPPGS